MDGFLDNTNYLNEFSSIDDLSADNQNIMNYHFFEDQNLCEQKPINISKPKKKPIFKPHYKWSKEEDDKLKELVIEYGENDWRHLAKKMENRNSRQCRERWNYYLNPKLKHGKWTTEEDSLIMNKYQELGPRWMEISKLFENRTDAMIKNRYNYLIRNQKRTKQLTNQFFEINNKNENYFEKNEHFNMLYSSFMDQQIIYTNDISFEDNYYNEMSEKNENEYEAYEEYFFINDNFTNFTI